MDKVPYLEFGFGDKRAERREKWFLRHIITPMHGKIRLSITDLVQVSRKIAFKIQGYREEFPPDQKLDAPQTILTVSNRIVRAHKFVHELYDRKAEGIPPHLVQLLCTEVCLPRYVGVVSITSKFIDPIEIILDTTGTLRTVQCLAVVPLGTSSYTLDVAAFLATEYDCELIADFVNAEE